ncbi:MAG: hypothetical protein EBX30_13390 [Betaproteobacteria bacterium]|nr:hypothetical protein [Betaproteobacteria bacterium]
MDVLALSSANLFEPTGRHQLMVTGNAGDEVKLVGQAGVTGTWSLAATGINLAGQSGTYNRYDNNSMLATVYVQSGITVQSNVSTPIVLSLDGAIATTSVNDGLTFAHGPRLAAVKTGWIAPSNALLVRDLNHDGVINDGSELFGDSTAPSTAPMPTSSAPTPPRGSFDLLDWNQKQNIAQSESIEEAIERSLFESLQSRSLDDQFMQHLIARV